MTHARAGGREGGGGGARGSRYGNCSVPVSTQISARARRSNSSRRVEARRTPRVCPSGRRALLPSAGKHLRKDTHTRARCKGAVQVEGLRATVPARRGVENLPVCLCVGAGAECRSENKSDKRALCAEEEEGAAALACTSLCRA